MSGFEIEFGVPLPDKALYGKTRKYPFDSMKVGDSFSFPDEHRKNVGAAAGYYGRKYGRRFVTACVGDGMARCWRYE